MKKLKLITLIILLCIGFQVTAQNKTSSSNWTKEEVKQELIDGFAQFVESVRPFYAKGDTYSQFLNKVFYGNNTNITKPIPILPPAGDGMLHKAYEYLSKGYNQIEIVKLGDYETMGNAVLFYNEEQKKAGKNANRTDLEAKLFGGNSTVLESNPLLAERGRCRWWQLSCHLSEIFGDDGGATITNGIIQLILTILGLG
ncbi:hypothetical protein ACFQO1_06185 [Jejudonia soesokkakensis]|uniref:Uncharacterized protein n=1 Tax=Jejudonia soesokkakensis TaxID=1323432 RepID=A0ABW2MT47_9FLAO